MNLLKVCRLFARSSLGDSTGTPRVSCGACRCQSKKMMEHIQGIYEGTRQKTFSHGFARIATDKSVAVRCEFLHSQSHWPPWSGPKCLASMSDMIRAPA